VAEPVFLPLTSLAPGQPADVAVAILSLAGCTDRRFQLLARGLPREWVVAHWPAADLRHQPSFQLIPLLNVGAWSRRYRRPWRSSEVGCSLSHRSALLAFLATTARLLLVLEDDVVPTTTNLLPALQELVTPLLEAAPQPLFCHLGPRPDQVNLAECRPLRAVGSALSDSLLVHQSRTRPFWRAHAYLISRETATRLIAMEVHGLELLADDWQARRQAGALGLVLMADPPLFLQDETIPSTQHEAIPPIVAKKSRASSLVQRSVQFLFDSFFHHCLSLADRLMRLFPYQLR
jgi:GR25 family glycosyltransferase involved in LPS biosynthesis